MNKTTIGVLLCLSGLILLHRNIVVIGLPAFITGILVMTGWRWPRR